MNRRQILKALVLFPWGMPHSAAFGSRRSNVRTTDPAAREKLRRQLIQNLSDVVDAWFPRTLDIKHGGFLCDFDENWRPQGPHLKRLEFQARQLRAAAQAALFDHGHRHARDAAEHGFRNLTETMWDKKYGGWMYLLHQNGEPVFTDKHMHGAAYAIQACVAYHDLTGKVEALEAAKAGFRWIDAHAHDPENGGYHPYLEQNGTPITSPSSGHGQLDPLGTPIGRKDCNTTMDLVEAISDLYRATSDRHVGGRLKELLAIVRDSMLQPAGTLVRSYTPDWKPADNLCEIGVNLQASSALIKASELMPAKLRGEVANIARTIVDACLRDVWDEGEGGFFHEGMVSDGAMAVADRKKAWWVQAEGARALLKQAIGKTDDAGRYFDRCLRLWSVIDLKLVDHTRGGWRQTASLTDSAKAHVWKDASHEVRALIECIQMLNGVK